MKKRPLPVEVLETSVIEQLSCSEDEEYIMAEEVQLVSPPRPPPLPSSPARSNGDVLSEFSSATTNKRCRNVKASKQTTFPLDPAQSSAVRHLGISAHTVECFRDFPPSHLNGMLLSQVIELTGNVKHCSRCGYTGHFGDQCLHWKTQLCQSEVETGACAFQDHCRFAHRNEAIRISHPVYCSRTQYTRGKHSTITIAVVLGCGSNRHLLSECPYNVCVLCAKNHLSSECLLDQMSHTATKPRVFRPPPSRKGQGRGRGGCIDRPGQGRGRGGCIDRPMPTVEYSPNSPSYDPRATN